MFFRGDTSDHCLFNVSKSVTGGAQIVPLRIPTFCLHTTLINILSKR